MSNAVISWAKENPLPAGAAALGVVVVALMLFGGDSQAADTTSAPEGQGLSAYYLAVSNQAAAGAAVQIEQIKANAGTNQALIAASYGIEKATIEQPATLASIEATRATTIDTNQKAFDLGWHTVDQNIALGNATLAANTALENARLTQQQNIAFKQINGKKASFLDSISQVVGIGSKVAGLFATGGASAALPAGTWV